MVQRVKDLFLCCHSLAWELWGIQNKTEQNKTCPLIISVAITIETTYFSTSLISLMVLGFCCCLVGCFFFFFKQVAKKKKKKKKKKRGKKKKKFPMPNFLQFQGRSRHPLKQVTNDGWFFVEKLRVSWKKEGQDRTGFPTRGLKNITLQKGAKISLESSQRENTGPFIWTINKHPFVKCLPYLQMR